MAHCRCSKSDVKMGGVQYPGYLEEVATKMENRHCDLLCRQRYLSDKITTMERSIPALMAYNLWMAEPTCDSAPFCKLQELMKKFSPYGDPTEKLLENLRKSAQDLQGETAQLHERIINTEVELEETDMQIESLQLANNEMNETLEKLEKEVRSYVSPSLHSIRSEDLSYLSKLRELAREELNLKRYIKDLETKETVFNEQIERLLTSKEFQGKCTGRRSCSPDCGSPIRQNIDESSKWGWQRKLEDPKAKMSSWIMNWWSGGKDASRSESKATDYRPRKIDNADPCICHSIVFCNKKASRGVLQSKPAKLQKQVHHHRCTPLNVRNANGKMLCTCDLALMDEMESKKFASRARSPPCEVPPCFTSDTVRKQSRGMRNPCNIRTPNETCKPVCKEMGPSARSGICRCNCKGKCAIGLSDVPCNCSSNSPTSGNYQPKPSPIPIIGTHMADTLDTGEDLCDCFPTCDCDSSEASSSCQCN